MCYIQTDESQLTGKLHKLFKFLVFLVFQLL